MVWRRQGSAARDGAATRLGGGLPAGGRRGNGRNGAWIADQNQSAADTKPKIRDVHLKITTTTNGPYLASEARSFAKLPASALLPTPRS